MFIDCLLYVGVFTYSISFNLHNTLQGSYFPSFTDEESEAQKVEGMVQTHAVNKATLSFPSAAKSSFQACNFGWRTQRPVFLLGQTGNELFHLFY